MNFRRWLLPLVLMLAAVPVWSEEPTEPSETPVESPAFPPLVLVAGATGRTGRLVILEAARAGFRVRGLARDVARARAAVPGNYAWVNGDVREPATLGAALSGVDYVISAIGATERSGPNSPEFVDYEGVRNLVDAARRSGVKQVILISSTGTQSGGGMLGWVINLLSGDILKWKAQGEAALRQSGLNYTIIRPAGLRDEPGHVQGIRFEQGDTVGYATISRTDLAAVSVAALGNAEAVGKSFEVFNASDVPLDAWKGSFIQMKRD